MTNNLKSRTMPVIISCILLSCGGGKNPSSEMPAASKEAFQGRIDSMELKMEDSKSFDKTLAASAGKAYSDFAFSFPDEIKAAEYLFKAAEISSGLNEAQQAIVYYKTICERV